MTTKYDVFGSKFAQDIYIQRYSLNMQETWRDTCHRVVDAVCGQHLDNTAKSAIYELMYNRVFIPGGRYLASAGRPIHNICNCFALFAEDSREGWGELLYKITMMLSLGGGVGVDYSRIRPSGSKISKTGGVASGPISLMKMVNEVGRYIRSGGNRRSALFAGLNWGHADIKSFMSSKNSNDVKQVLQDVDGLSPLALDGTNISVIYDSEFFRAMDNKGHGLHDIAKGVWDTNCLQAFSTAEPGFSFNFLKDSESGRNACAEYTTDDDSDSCNLGTIYINRIKNKEEMAHATKYANAFLLCGGIYTDCPTAKCRDMRDKNNRIGLGLGGLAEWMVVNEGEYGVSPTLHKLLNVWEQESDSSAYMWARDLDVAIPKAKRAIAPNGTTGIIAGTTGGIEPIFCKAYKRKYYEGMEIKYQFVIDPVVKRLLDTGFKVEQIQDAADIDFKTRVKTQADVQQYVDMSISSTCNLPVWGSEKNNETTLKEYSKILLRYAKRLRGFTCYPDGCRNGQPLERVSIEEAANKEGLVFEGTENTCRDGVCNI